jgi:ribonuclease E
MQAAGQPAGSGEAGEEVRRERGGRGERGGRRSRGDRGNAQDDGAAAAAAETAAPTESAATDDTRARAEGGEERPQRERRSRDRYGRERRGERAEAASQTPYEATPEAASENGESAAPSHERRDVTPATDVSAAAPVAAQAPTLPPAPAATADSPAPRQSAPAADAPRSGMPAIGAYQLPLQDLMQVAQASGLQWVHSDAEKISQVRAAIAAEPKPLHVPRERPPAVQLDEGPLILVETRRDLRSMPLPFEAAQNQP